MSYCNKEASIALKEVGFDEPTTNFFLEDENDFNSEHIAAPDHLQASDWLWEKYEIHIDFIIKEETHCDDKRFTGPDSRDLAIIAACEIIKERRETNG